MSRIISIFCLLVFSVSMTNAQSTFTFNELKVWISGATPPTATTLVYGKIYFIQNGYNNYTGGFLETKGGQNCQSQGSLYCVSTAVDHSRGKFDEWKILPVSAGKKIGDPVSNNDIIMLESQRNNAGSVLGVKGLDKEDPKNPGYATIFTYQAKQTNGSTNWKISGSSGNGFLEQLSDLNLQNQWTNEKTYLDVNGTGCQDNLMCVSGSKDLNRDGKSGTWRFEPK